jgi:hypothetical protein
MSARNVAALASLALLLIVAGCTGFYEIPIETPIQPKMDVSGFQRVLVAGFLSGGTEDVDANLETVRLLRSQLRSKSSLRVIEADPLPLAEIAADQQKANGTSEPITLEPVSPVGAPTGSGNGSSTTNGSSTSTGSSPTTGSGTPPATQTPEAPKPEPPQQADTPQPQPQPSAPAAQKPDATKPDASKPAATDHKPVDPKAAGEPKIKNEKDFQKYDKIFADTAYWKKLGEEYQNPLIVTGTVLFTPHQAAGFVTTNREVYDSFGRRSVIPVRTYMERKGFILQPKFVFIDGRTGAILYSENFREEILYNAQQNTPALSSYFELMDRLVPSFLSTLSAQKVRGSRVLLK